MDRNSLQLPKSSCVFFMLGIATLILFFARDTTSCMAMSERGSSLRVLNWPEMNWLQHPCQGGATAVTTAIEKDIKLPLIKSALTVMLKSA